MNFLVLLSALLLDLVAGLSIPVNNYSEKLANELSDPVFYIDKGRVEEVVCPTIYRIRDIVLEPLNNANGNFSHNLEKENIFLFRHNRIQQCQQPELMTCDQLIITPLTLLDFDIIFEVQYIITNITGQSQQTFKFSIGPQEIIYNGDLPIVLYENRPLPFHLRPKDNNGIEICSVDNDNHTSTLLKSTPPDLNTTCILPTKKVLGLNDLLQVTVSAVNNEKSFTERAILLQGMCPGSADTLASAIFEISYQAEGPTTPSTTPSEGVSTTTDDGSDSLPIIIGSTLGIILLLILIGVAAVTVVIICYKRSKLTSGINETDTVLTNFEQRSTTELNQEEKILDLNTTPVPISNGGPVQGGEDCTTHTRAEARPKHASGLELLAKPRELSTPVMKTIAFVTSDDSTTSFTPLEEELLRLHHCVRLSDDLGGDDRVLTLNDRHRRICQWLVKKKDCLVFIIWHGKLEGMQSGTFIKDIVKLLSCRAPLLDSSQDNVMTKLVFVQLGSKGSADCSASPHNSTWVSYKHSPSDKQFDTKQCGKDVFESIMAKLEAQPRDRAIRNGGDGQGQRQRNASRDTEANKEILDKIDKLHNDMVKGFTGQTHQHRETHDGIAELQLAPNQDQNQEDPS